MISTRPLRVQMPEHPSEGLDGRAGTSKPEKWAAGVAVGGPLLWSRRWQNGWLVEVAGIEPASASAEPGLLRVQPAVVFLSPSDLAGVSLPGSVAVVVPVTPATQATSSGSLDDASYRTESTPGLTDLRSSLRRRGRSRRDWNRHLCFARSVHEITVHPRPASPGITTNVETDHPRGDAALPDGLPNRSATAVQLSRPL